jgi:hypothetical protein
MTPPFEDEPAPPYPATACFDSLVTDPRFAVLAGKVDLAGATRAPDFNLLVQTERPSDEEKSALLEWFGATDHCLELASIIDRARTPALVLRARLYNREITYGDFARGRAELRASIEREWKPIQQQLLQQAAIQYELARQRSADQTALFLYGLNASRPVTTQCRRTFFGVDCTTR